MSHELRTPLNATLGYVDLLELGIRGPLTDTQRADLQRIRLANQHLLSLINDILNFARLEAGRLEYHPERLLLDSVVAELEPLVAPLLSAKGIAFEHDSCSTDTPGAPHGILADRERVRQVLLNLITNAVKFTETGGRVTITCVDDVVAPVVHIIVSDTGRGIPAADLARIFEPFVQIDRHATHASQQGVGLGLAISRELARGMNGDLTVTSEVGRGSAFTLTLPRATLET
jgi:signal transduction histidine kinase